MRLLEAAGLPPGVINLVPGDGLAVSEVALAHPAPRRHPLHRLDADVQAPVARGRGEPRQLPRLPAARRRDRRQGLRPRAPVGRRRRAADGAGPRRVRVPGAEVLGRLARLRPAARCGAGSQDDLVDVSRGADRWARHRLLELHGRGDRRAGLRASTWRRSSAPGAPAASRSWPAASYDDSEGWFVRPTVLLGEDPTDEMFSTEYFGPILAVHVFDDARYDEVLDAARRRRRRTR